MNTKEHGIIQNHEERREPQVKVLLFTNPILKWTGKK
jgi:hypothetical protein